MTTATDRALALLRTIAGRRLTRGQRLWLYAVAAALLVLAATYGLVNDEQRAAWLYLFAALFGVAADHVPGQAEQD